MNVQYLRVNNELTYSPIAGVRINWRTDSTPKLLPTLPSWSQKPPATYHMLIPTALLIQYIFSVTPVAGIPSYVWVDGDGISTPAAILLLPPNVTLSFPDTAPSKRYTCYYPVQQFL